MPVNLYTTSYSPSIHHLINNINSRNSLSKNSSYSNNNITQSKYRNTSLFNLTSVYSQPSSKTYKLSSTQTYSPSSSSRISSKNNISPTNNRFLSSSSLTSKNSLNSPSSNSSTSSINSISSSYNNLISGLSSPSSVILTAYSNRKSSVGTENEFKNTITSLKTSSSYVSILSPKWRKVFAIEDKFENTIPSYLSGLTNIGNTCYMNSVLQALYSTDLFRRFVFKSFKGSLLCALGRLFDEMKEDKNNSVYPGVFRNQFIKYQSKFRGYEQQDAQEFLRYLINGIHDEVNQAKYTNKPKNFKKPKSSFEAWEQYKCIDDSPLIDFVAGQLSSTISCTVCEYSSTCYDPFWDLSLSLPFNVNECNVQKCLQEFTALELLAPDELINCKRCNKQTRSTKKLNIVKLPKILILHLKRFSNEGYKLSSPKIIPNETLEINGEIFDLYSIVCHHGYSSKSGHYTAYCKFSEKWYHFNDEKVTESNKFSPKNCKDAYILFYSM